MTNIRIAEIGDDNIVIRVIECPEGSTESFPGETLGLPGTWVIDDATTAGPGAVFNPEDGSFNFVLPDIQDEEPPPDEPPPEEPTE